LGKPWGVGKLEWGGNREGMGRGRSFTSDLGPGWIRIAPRKKEGSQVSKRDLGERRVSKRN
jgi:hypothetical protein